VRLLREWDYFSFVALSSIGGIRVKSTSPLRPSRLACDPLIGGTDFAHALV
jgi:hypothetical protein